MYGNGNGYMRQNGNFGRGGKPRGRGGPGNYGMGGRGRPNMSGKRKTPQECTNPFCSSGFGVFAPELL